MSSFLLCVNDVGVYVQRTLATDKSCIVVGNIQLSGISPGTASPGFPPEVNRPVIGVGRTYTIFDDVYLNERKGVSFLTGDIFGQTDEIDLLGIVTLSISASSPFLNLTPLDAAVELAADADVDTLYYNVYQIVGQGSLVLTASADLSQSYIPLAASVTLAIQSLLHSTIQAAVDLTMTVVGDLTTSKYMVGTATLALTTAVDFTTHPKSNFVGAVTLFAFAQGYLTTATNLPYVMGMKWYRSTDLDSLVPDDVLVTGGMVARAPQTAILFQKDDPPPAQGSVIRQLRSENILNFTEDTEIELVRATNATSALVIGESTVLVGLEATDHGYDIDAASDKFDRANGSLGSNWATPTNGWPLQISSEKVYRLDNHYCIQYWTTDDFGNAHYSQCAVPLTYGVLGPAVRIQTGIGSCYMLFGSADGQISIGKIVNSIYSATLASWSATWADQDLFKLEADGTTLSAYVNGLLIGSTTDSSFSTGKPGLVNSTSVLGLSNWQAGPAGPATIGKFALLSENDGASYVDVYPDDYGYSFTDSWAKVNGFIKISDTHIIAYGEFHPVFGEYDVAGDNRYSIIGYHSYDGGKTWGDPIIVAGTPDGSGTIYDHTYATCGAFLSGAVMIGCYSTEGRAAVWRSTDYGVTWVECKPASTWANHRIAESRGLGSGGYFGLAIAQDAYGAWVTMLLGFFKAATEEYDTYTLLDNTDGLAGYEHTQTDDKTFLYVWRSTSAGVTWEDVSEAVHAQIEPSDDPNAQVFSGWGWLVGLSIGDAPNRGFLLALDGVPDDGIGTAIHYYSNTGYIWYPCTYDTGVFPNGTSVRYYRLGPGDRPALTQRRVMTKQMVVYDDLASVDPADTHFFLRGEVEAQATETTFTPSGGYHLGGDGAGGNITVAPRPSVSSYASGGYIFGGAAATLGIPKYTWPATVDPPDYPLEERTKRSVLRSSPTAGTVNTRSRWQRQRRVFHLHWEAISTTQRNSIVSFLETTHGGAIAFDWIHPLTSVTYTVRLVGDTLETEHLSPNIWRVGFDIEEL